MAKFDRLRVKSQQEPEPRASSYRASAYLLTYYWAINKLRVKSEAGLRLPCQCSNQLAFKTPYIDRQSHTCKYCDILHLLVDICPQIKDRKSIRIKKCFEGCF